MNLPDIYDPKEAEQRWQKYWDEHHIYAFDPHDKKREIYSIDTPPPTVSGKMHLGHAFSYSQEDFIARYQRMRNKNVFYPFGTDDNGLATEKLIEKTKGVTSKKMDRDEFISLCVETLKDIRPTYLQDWKRIGMSCDFSIFYSTINEHSRRISQRSFLQLYQAGRIYQEKAPIIFCPACKTAIAQVEMEDVEKKTTLNYIKAKMETGEYIIYATTRPELHPGCVGISVDQEGAYVTVERNMGTAGNTGKIGNTEEKWIISKAAVEKLQAEFPMKIVKEYSGKQLLGKKVHIPFAQQPVQVSHDISAKTEYGSGIVFYCTYGGLDCVEWMARHPEVKPVLIMDESGTYNEKSPYRGLRSEEARQKILQDLEQQGVLIKKQPLTHAVNVHERCSTDIEYVATKQWFIKYLDLREKFLAAGNKLNWYPKHMKTRYDNWIKGLKWNWCISRQRHFGVPMPVWYHRKTGEVILPTEDQLPVDPLKDVPKGYAREDVIAEKDVLDTWATSSMTPQLAIELFDDPALRKRLFPMSLRPQAHDIITFWLFNTLVKSQLHYQQNPWKDVVISGHAQDPHGKKMSKSKGNIVEPQEMVEKFSADALRFWSAGSKLGDDLPFQEKDLMTGKKFTNKLWNAAKFSLTHLEDYAPGEATEVFDRWLLSKLQKLIRLSTEAFEQYEFFKVKTETENFFWHTFCDYYLEIVKDRLYNPSIRGVDARKSAQQGVYEALITILKLMAPIMPHITEEIYQLYFSGKEKKKSIHLSSWPVMEERYIDEQAELIGDLGIDIISSVRKWKSEQQMSLKEEINSLVVVSSEKGFAEMVQHIEGDLRAVLNVKKILFTGATSLETERLGVKVGVVR